MEDIKLLCGDCLVEMDKLIDSGVKVDAVIADIPYGMTACRWDSVIPFDEMWIRLDKLIKSNGAIVLFGSEPFSSALRMSNIKNYKYDWYWIKEKGTGFQISRKQPLRKVENILVFYKKQPFYNSQGKKLDKPYTHTLPINKSDTLNPMRSFNNNEREYVSYTHSKKENTLFFSRGDNRKNVHPTQKPIKLMKYLVKTYTNENELILDFCMGSGTTILAAKNLNRRAIGIELDENYFNIACKRMEDSNV